MAEEIFKSITSTDSRREIVHEMLDSDKNIELKTEIENVIAYATLETLTEQTKINLLKKSASTLDNYTNNIYKLSLSKKRKSREEYIDSLKALSAFNEQQTQQPLKPI